MKIGILGSEQLRLMVDQMVDVKSQVLSRLFISSSSFWQIWHSQFTFIPICLQLFLVKIPLRINSQVNTFSFGARSNFQMPFRNFALR